MSEVLKNMAKTHYYLSEHSVKKYWQLIIKGLYLGITS
jgi:hypothetical protein